MENNSKNQKEKQDECDELNANSAYSGSGSWQPGGDTAEAGKLSGNERQKVKDQSGQGD